MTRLRVYLGRAIIRKWGLYVPFLLTCRTVHCFESQVRRASLYAPCLARTYFLALSVALRDKLSIRSEMKHFLSVISRTIGKGNCELRDSYELDTCNFLGYVTSQTCFLFAFSIVLHRFDFSNFPSNVSLSAINVRGQHDKFNIYANVVVNFKYE